MLFRGPMSSISGTRYLRFMFCAVCAERLPATVPQLNLLNDTADSHIASLLHVSDLGSHTSSDTASYPLSTACQPRGQTVGGGFLQPILEPTHRISTPPMQPCPKTDQASPKSTCAGGGGTRMQDGAHRRACQTGRDGDCSKLMAGFAVVGVLGERELETSLMRSGHSHGTGNAIEALPQANWCALENPAVMTKRFFCPGKCEPQAIGSS